MMQSLLLSMLLAAQAVSAPVLPREPKQGGVYVVAHRGVHEGIPENTLAAYQKAIDIGADFVEIDLRETRDGKFVSVHNADLDDYTEDASGPVSGYTLAELQAFDIGSRVGPEWAAERIPGFEDILELCRGRIGIYLDMKQGDVEKAAAIVREYGLTKEVLWYVGGAPLRKLKEYCPECVIMPDPGSERNLGRILEAVSPKVVASVWENMSATFAETCHAAGAKVIVDDDGPGTWDTLLGWGVDGIQTDHVADLIARLRERAEPAAAPLQAPPKDERP